MNTDLPRIAVIVPAYNAVAHIRETIQSILEQTRPADEIVVVDDGSTDDTASVAAKVSDKVTVVRQKNGGQGSARQRGMKAVTADWLLFLDADDLLYPVALEKLAATLANNPVAALAYSTVELWSPGGSGISRLDTLVKPVQENVWCVLLNGNFIHTPGCVLMRRSALNAVGGWDVDDRLRGNEDWELWLRLAEKHSFVTVNEPLLKYRVHDAGYSKSRHKMFQSLFFMFGRQRARWKHDVNRSMAIDAAEWHNCKYVIQEIWRGNRPAGSMLKRPSLAIRICELVQIGARPTFHHFISAVPRCMLR